MVSEAGSPGGLTKRERLELILQKEKEKDKLENKTLVKHTPAQYRKLLLSTSNRTIGSTGTRDQDASATKKATSKRPGANAGSRRVVSSAERKKKLGKMETVKSLLFDAPDGYQSVFQGKRPSKTAVAQRTSKEKSAWAKIAQFEQDMYSLQVKAEKLENSLVSQAFRDGRGGVLKREALKRIEELMKEQGGVGCFQILTFFITWF